MSDLTFMDRMLRGEVMADEIDDFVDFWHDSDSSVPLHEFLGMSEAEYGLWVSSPSMLGVIVNARYKKQRLADAVNDNLRQRRRLAARSDKGSLVSQLERWIASQPDR